MSTAPVELWLEFASTYSYPAAMRAERVAAERGIEIRWRAFLLGPIFKAQGWTDSPFNLFPAKGRYMWRDLQRVCAAEGLAFTRPSVFPRNGLTAARIACRFAEEPWVGAFIRGVYQANFRDDRDIAEDAVLADCLRAAGADPDHALAEARTDSAKAALRANTERAAELGIFGAPTFVVGTELFWGNDRLEGALEHCVATPDGSS